MAKGIKGSSKTYKCLHCGTENKWKYQGNVSNKFCNNDCQQSYRILEGINVDRPTKATAYSYMRRFVEYKCSCCGINEWNGKPLTLQVDHINGDNTLHRKENLRWICPNCHTQTDTWGVKNASEDGRARMVEGARKRHQLQMVS
jgi:hypothetical protein